MREVVAAAIVAGLAACTPSTSASASGGAPAASTTSAASNPPTASGDGGVRPDERGTPEPLRVDVIGKICGVATCSGKLSRLRVFYTPAGRIHRYAHDGDVTRCSHPPTTVYDADGKEVGGIPLEPIQPGSDRAKEIDALHARLFGDAKHVLTADCQGRVLPQK